MNILDFQNKLQLYRIFSLQDIRKSFPNFSYRQLDRWEKKGYLRKIRRGFYMLEQQEIDQNILALVANKIYAPSYISLTSALKYYGLIPEEIFHITSVSSKKTMQFFTPTGTFSYQHIKPELFWGYSLIPGKERGCLMADPEKAILDYLYLNPQLKTPEDFLSLRIDEDMFTQHIDFDTLYRYLEQFSNHSLARRTHTFLTIFASG